MRVRDLIKQLSDLPKLAKVRIGYNQSAVIVMDKKGNQTIIPLNDKEFYTNE